jgi:hypothetical protein
MKIAREGQGISLKILFIPQRAFKRGETPLFKSIPPLQTTESLVCSDAPFGEGARG